MRARYRASRERPVTTRWRKTLPPPLCPRTQPRVAATMELMKSSPATMAEKMSQPPAGRGGAAAWAMPAWRGARGGCRCSRGSAPPSRRGGGSLHEPGGDHGAVGEPRPPVVGDPPTADRGCRQAPVSVMVEMLTVRPQSGGDLDFHLSEAWTSWSR